MSLLALDNLQPLVSSPAVSLTIEDYRLEGSPVYSLAFILPDLSKSGMHASNISLKLKNDFIDLPVPFIFTNSLAALLKSRNIIDVSTSVGPSTGGTLVVLTLSGFPITTDMDIEENSKNPIFVSFGPSKASIVALDRYLQDLK